MDLNTYLVDIIACGANKGFYTKQFKVEATSEDAAKNVAKEFFKKEFGGIYRAATVIDLSKVITLNEEEYLKAQALTADFKYTIVDRRLYLVKGSTYSVDYTLSCGCTKRKSVKKEHNLLKIGEETTCYNNRCSLFKTKNTDSLSNLNVVKAELFKIIGTPLPEWLIGVEKYFDDFGEICFKVLIQDYNSDFDYKIPPKINGVQITMEKYVDE